MNDTGDNLHQSRLRSFSRQLGWACALTLILLSAASSMRAQGGVSQQVAAARIAAEQSLLTGRYEQVETIAQPFAQDDVLTAIRARALVARGEYAKAEQLLQPIAAENAVGESALELGLLQMMLGRRSEGRRTLQVILLGEARSSTARDFLRAARAARALGRFEDAKALFREADAILPNDPAINTAWGDMFNEKFAPGEAAKSFQIALKTDAAYQPALLGMARAVADENPPAAEQFAQKALSLNPNDVAALLFLAELAIDEDKKDDARKLIARAQAINPNSLEAHALTAALHYVDGNDAGYKQAITAALKLNPVYGEGFRMVGEITARYYRFDEAAEQVRRALAIDRDNPRAQADLGAHLMRTGDERNARRALESAFRADPYDVVTYNLLDLLDTLDTFKVITDGDLVIKLHPDEVGVMQHFAPALAREAIDALSKRWEFTPKGPILIELFPKHDDFAVRTVGLPGMIGALGACFGRVVTLDSPKAREPGTFNWGATLWHEMAHVITLQLSNQRIPRWLTEGISVFEETRARPEWGREMELPFARAIDDGEVLKLKDLNAGFQNPRTISLAYYQASLLVEHIVAKFGEPALRALVKSFADGIDTETAIKKVLSTDMDALQISFDAFLEQRYAPLRQALRAPEGVGLLETPADKIKELAVSHPKSFAVQLALGRALRSSDPAGAIQAYERAAALVPHVTGPESAYAQIVEIAMARGDKAKAAEALEKMTAQDHQAVEAARQLVSLLDPDKDKERLRVAYRRVIAIDPFDAAANAGLGRMALASGDTAEAIRSFKVALAAGPVDRASAHADLAEGFFQAGQRDEAKRETLSALEIAPTYGRAQDLLLKLQGAR